MKVLLVGNYAPDRQFSMRHFAHMLERGLRERGLTVQLLNPRPVLFPNVDRVDGIWKWVGYLNKFVLFPIALRRAARAVDLVHICDHANAPYVNALRGIRHLVTCHDVIAIRAARGLEDSLHFGWTGRRLQSWILAGLARAQRIACDSTLTQDQLLGLLPQLRERSVHIPCGLNHPFAPVPADQVSATLQGLGVPDRPYFLQVGSGLVRKNRAHTVRVFARMLAQNPGLPQGLVFVGAPRGADIAGLVEKFGLEARVTYLSDVAPEQLPALYSGASALFFPSLAEGFGWPVIEAQACGCPVICSQRRPMCDIAGDAAVYIDPLDVEASAQTILRSLPDLDALRAPGLVNAERYIAHAMVDAYLAQYRVLLAQDQESTSTLAMERS